jgi:hypothetical protein
MLVYNKVLDLFLPLESSSRWLRILRRNKLICVCNKRRDPRMKGISTASHEPEVLDFFSREFRTVTSPLAYSECCYERQWLTALERKESALCRSFDPRFHLTLWGYTAKIKKNKTQALPETTLLSHTSVPLIGVWYFLCASSAFIDVNWLLKDYNCLCQ